jgi:hypothetical protein
VVSGWWKDHDEERDDEVSSTAWAATSTASAGGAEWRLEVGVGAGALRVSSGDAIYCTTEQKRGITGCAIRREGR